MKIYLGGGAYLEPDIEPRATRFHMGIVRIERIPNTRSGYNATLECGHGVQVYGDLVRTRGIVLCTKCRDLSEGE